MIITKEDFKKFSKRCYYVNPDMEAPKCYFDVTEDKYCTEETCPRIDNNELLSSVMELKDTLRKHNIT